MFIYEDYIERSVKMQKLAMCISNSNENVTPIETIKAIKDAGFKNVFIQWYNKDWEYSQEEQLEYIRKLGLNIIFAHLGYKNINALWEEGEIGDTLVTNYLQDIDICSKNNISLLVMHLTSKKIAPPYSELGLERIRRVTNYAKQKNIKVAFENNKIKGYLEYVLGNIKDDNVGLCFDAGHWHTHFNDEFDFEMSKDRIFAVHLHDNDQSDDQHLIPFDGTINWKLVVSKLKENNYKGPITLEVFYSSDYLKLSPLEFYQKSYDMGQKISKMFDEK